MSVLDFLHPEPALPLHNFGRTDPAFFVAGKVQLDLLLPILDFAHMGFLVPLQSHAWLGSLLLILDPLVLGFSMFLQTSC